MLCYLVYGQHNNEKSSTCPNKAHSREVEYPTIDSNNTFEIPFDFIEQYPPNILIQPTLDPSYTSSPDIPHQNSSSNKEI